jgi:hypothetical protein
MSDESKRDEETPDVEGHRLMDAQDPSKRMGAEGRQDDDEGPDVEGHRLMGADAPGKRMEPGKRM